MIGRREHRAITSFESAPLGACLAAAAHAVQKYLKDYARARHTLIHKHSWLDIKLRRIELFYLPDLSDLQQDDEWGKRLKTLRATYLRDYLIEKKTEFSKANSELAELLDSLFTSLLAEYERQCKKLE